MRCEGENVTRWCSRIGGGDGGILKRREQGGGTINRWCRGRVRWPRLAGNRIVRGCLHSELMDQAKNKKRRKGEDNIAKAPKNSSKLLCLLRKTVNQHSHPCLKGFLEQNKQKKYGDAFSLTIKRTMAAWPILFEEFVLICLMHILVRVNESGTTLLALS